MMSNPNESAMMTSLTFEFNSIKKMRNEEATVRVALHHHYFFSIPLLHFQLIKAIRNRHMSLPNFEALALFAGANVDATANRNR